MSSSCCICKKSIISQSEYRFLNILVKIFTWAFSSPFLPEIMISISHTPIKIGKNNIWTFQVSMDIGSRLFAQ